MSNEKQITITNLTLEILKTMSYVGCNPKIRTFSANFFGILLGIISFVLTFLFFLNFIFTEQSFDSIMDDGVVFVACIQITAKFYFTIKEARLLSNMLDLVWHQFWLTDILDNQSKQYMQSLYKMADVATKAIQSGVTTCALLFLIRAGLKGNQTLLMEIWIPFKEYLKISPYYEILFAFQGITFVMSASCLVSPIDRLFIVLTCSVCIQFKMICINLLKIGPQNSDEENQEIIKVNVAQHVKLLRFLKSFEEVYSKLFLPTLATSFLALSLSMYGITVVEDFNKRLVYVISCIALLLQIFAYCFAGQFIQDEGLKVCSAAYNCIWYDMDSGVVQKSLIKIIMQSQKTLEISIGGLLDLSMYSFSGVLRASFSFMMFIVNSKSENV